MRQRGPLLGSWYRKFSEPPGLGKASDNYPVPPSLWGCCGLCLRLLVRLSLCEALTLCFPPPACVDDFPGCTPKLHLHMTLELQGPPVNPSFSIPAFRLLLWGQEPLWPSQLGKHCQLRSCLHGGLWMGSKSKEGHLGVVAMATLGTRRKVSKFFSNSYHIIYYAHFLIAQEYSTLNIICLCLMYR